MVNDPGWTDQTEDWPKQSWDFWLQDGRPVDNLSDLCDILGGQPDDVAQDLLRLPFGRYAPPELIAEARELVGG
jgi:hypothetical protein